MAAPGTLENANQQRIQKLLRDNWVAPKRSLLGSLNEFFYWEPQQVSELFQLLPPVPNDRKLYPLGPEHGSIPTGSQRWLELGQKVALLTAVDVISIPFSPLLMFRPKEERGKVFRDMRNLHVETVSSSFFVKLPLEAMDQAARNGMALCVNKWGQYQMMDSGYAAISHVWAETMGLEFNNEKTDQDERGLNRAHFHRIMDVVCRTGFEWFWFDILSIPKNSSDITRRVKLLVINSLRNVYKNADAVIVLDSLAVQLNSGNPLDVAAILSCGQWLSRVWTYQEAKLARMSKIITATHTVDFGHIVHALKEVEARDSAGYRRWHELRLTFDRLLPHTEVGILLLDIALSCATRSTTNEVDNARAFFALLGLTWQDGWSYENGMVEILRSQPQHAVRIAGMHGPRGLPVPYGWAPKYLVQLQGTIRGGLEHIAGSLVGYWYTVTVTTVLQKGVSASTDGYVCNILVLNARNEQVQIQISLFPKMWSGDLENWVEHVVPSGKARLLCGDDMVRGSHSHCLLLASVQHADRTPELELDVMGTVAGTAALNDGSVEGTRLRWALS